MGAVRRGRGIGMTRFLGIVAAGICAVAAVGLATAHRSHAMPNPNACSSMSPCLNLSNGGKGEAIDGTANKNNGLILGFQRRFSAKC